MSAEMVVRLFTLVIYIGVLSIFDKARIKYAGGKVGTVINLILVTVALLFVADYCMLLSSYLSATTIATTQALIRTAALAILGLGGSRLVG